MKEMFIFVVVLCIFYFIIKLIKESINSKTTNSESINKIKKEKYFKLRFNLSWFSHNYVTPEYSDNGGITWKPLLTFGPRIGADVLDNHILEPISYRLGNGDFDYEKNYKWNTLEKCIEHNEKVKRDLIQFNKSLKQQREERNNRRKEALRRLNQ